MKLMFSVVVAVMVMSLAFAEEKPRGFFAGKIVSVDVPSRMLQVKSEKSEMTFAVAPDAKIIGADKRELSLGDLKAGDEVTVDYTEDDGLYVAHTITLKELVPPQPLRPSSSVKSTVT